jgi:hypothetical protein
LVISRANSQAISWLSEACTAVVSPVISSDFFLPSLYVFFVVFRNELSSSSSLSTIMQVSGSGADWTLISTAS